MSDSFFGDVGNAIADVTNAIGETISDFGTGLMSGLLSSGVGTNPNLLISSFRAQGIPPGAQSNYNYSPVSAKFSSSVNQTDWRVRISHDSIYKQNPVMAPLTATGGLVFPYLPTITMSHTATYETIQTAHTNYPFLAYKNSQVDDITITGQFTVQSQEEALHWLASMHFLRTVTKMYFGQGNNLGNPPPICTLNGYGEFVYNDVSVVVKSFNITLEKDVDYIAAQIGVTTGSKSGTNVSYVPTLSTITVVVAPVYSREKIKLFNLNAFAQGQLIVGADNKGFI
jgi:hypothetical protein